MPPEGAASISDLELMERYGIRRTTTVYYHCGQYRHDNLEDAVAQAERDKRNSVWLLS